MSFLLDTHVFLWYISGHSSLSPRAKGIIEAKTGLKFSIASLWEISIKVNIGKLKLTGSFDDLLTRLNYVNAEILAIAVEDTRSYMNLSLPPNHRDPFDRILIAQAINHSLSLVSADKKFDAYPVKRVWS